MTASIGGPANTTRVPSRGRPSSSSESRRRPRPRRSTGSETWGCQLPGRGGVADCHFVVAVQPCMLQPLRGWTRLVEVQSRTLFGGISLSPRGGSVGDVQTMVHRQGGRRANRVASGLLGAALAIGSTAALGSAGTSKALAAEPGKEPLPGHQSQVPPGATLIGPAPAGTTLPLVVTLLPRDPVALGAEVRAVSNPHSSEYRHFLTPAQFAQRFGATPGTIAHVTAALRHEGLTVGAPSSTGLSLPVSGTVAQIQSAFSTPIERYHLASGKTGYDNKSAPQVPVAVAPQIQGILGLNTLSPPKPSTSVPQASPASPHVPSFSAAPALAPGPTFAAARLVYDQYRQCSDRWCARCRSVGAGVFVRFALLREPLRGGDDRRPCRDVGRRVPVERHPGLCYVLRHLARRQPDHSNGHRRRRCNGRRHRRGGAGHRECALPCSQGEHRGLRGWTADSIYNVFSRIVSDDTAKIVSASWTNGCEAYVPQSYQNSENTLFQAAAAEGQSIFAATGDQGSQGCNINGAIEATTGGDPVAQAVDSSTGTLYIANKTSNSVSVDSEGGTNASNAGTASSVSTGTGSAPDAVALDSTDHKVFVANAAGTLTVFSSITCNQTTTSGCGSPTQIASGGHLSSPAALAVNGSTLYVGNSGNGTVAVYDASTNTWKATVNLRPPRSSPHWRSTPPTASSTARIATMAGSSTSTPRPATRPTLRRAGRRQPQSPSATLRSPLLSPASPATCTWPTPGVVEASQS